MTAIAAKLSFGNDVVSVSSGSFAEMLAINSLTINPSLRSDLPYDTLTAGSLKLLAVADHRRNKQFPQVQTLDETIKGLSYEGIFGFIAPAGLPPETLKALHADIVKVLADPGIREQLDRQSMDVMASSPAEFAAAIRSEIEHWKQAVKESGARLG